MIKNLFVTLFLILCFRNQLFSQENAIGYYGGAFEAVKYDESKKPSYSNKITIHIENLSNNKIKGESIVAGNKRPFTGTYAIEKNSTISVEAKEPGDDKYDGVFTFKIYPAEQIIGNWKSYNSKLAVTERNYTLEFFKFKYDANLKLSQDISWTSLYQNIPDYDNEVETLTEDVVKYNPSKTLLKKEDIENMHKGDLEVLRNSIYARHGYSFKNRKMRYVFDSFVSWYHPISTDIRKQLTGIEKKNEDLLKRYEEHAKKYYDVYGR